MQTGLPQDKQAHLNLLTKDGGSEIKAEGANRSAIDAALGAASACAQKYSLVVLTAIICLAYALRMVRLGASSVWIDEIWSISIARLPWRAFFWTVQNQDPNTSLYYAMLHFWIRLGNNEFAVRSMSVLLAAATVPAIYFLGSKLFGKSAGLIAGLLLAVNLFHLQWSQEARAYSLVVLLVTLATLLFVRGMERSALGTWLAYAVFGILAVYAHLFGALVLAAHWASLIFLKPRQVPWKGLIASSAAIGVFSLPLLYLIHLRSKLPFVPLGWLPKPTAHNVYDVFYSLAGNAEYPGSQGGKPIVVVYAILCLIAVLAAAKSWRSSGRSTETWKLGLLLCWLFLPIAIVFVVSLVQPFFMARYLLICAPAIVLLAARGIQVIPTRAMSLIALVITVCLAVVQLPHYYRHRVAFQEWRSVTSYVLANENPGDGIVFCVAPGKLLFDYYAGGYQHSTNGSMDFIYPTYGDEREDPQALNYLPPFDDVRLNSAAQKHQRTWLIIYHDHFPTTKKASGMLEATLASQYPKVEQKKIDGVTLFLYSGQTSR